jgi:hypothetical protein
MGAHQDWSKDLLSFLVGVFCLGICYGRLLGSLVLQALIDVVVLYLDVQLLYGWKLLTVEQIVLEGVLNLVQRGTEGSFVCGASS